MRVPVAPPLPAGLRPPGRAGGEDLPQLLMGEVPRKEGVASAVHHVSWCGILARVHGGADDEGPAAAKLRGHRGRQPRGAAEEHDERPGGRAPHGRLQRAGQLVEAVRLLDVAVVRSHHAQHGRDRHAADGLVVRHDEVHSRRVARRARRGRRRRRRGRGRRRRGGRRAAPVPLFDLDVEDLEGRRSERLGKVDVEVGVVVHAVAVPRGEAGEVRLPAERLEHRSHLLGTLGPVHHGHSDVQHHDQRSGRID
mmetsp:Transcript_70580/g.185040  ORF Transcript_70580/g.185040 Transcript_70580/m.185040 type:complete len:252 (+) Transcript_70580:80-835(+)